VSAAAAPSMSQTTIRAPSSANRSEASRPIPMPAPVISATLPVSRPAMPVTFPRAERDDRRAPRSMSAETSDPLEVPDELPVRHDLIDRPLLEAAVMDVVVHDLGAEGLARDLRARELIHRVPQRRRHLGESRVLVGVTRVELGRLELAPDPVEPRRD